MFLKQIPRITAAMNRFPVPIRFDYNRPERSSRAGRRAFERQSRFTHGGIIWYVFRSLVAGMVVLLGGGGTATAACTDPAAPEVQWLRCYLDGRPLTGVDLKRANIRESSFQRSDLSGASLGQVNGYRSKMISTRLTEASLEGASFIEADFTRADLTRASLKNTDLRRARFYRAILHEADLTGARLEGADLLDADLTGTTWTNGRRVCGANSIGQCN